MKKYLLFFIILSIFLFNFCSDNRVELDLVVITDSLPAGSAIYITGNDQQLGNWQPNVVQFQKSEEGKWTKNFSFERGKKLEFKITRGSWETEALNPDSSTPPNYRIEISNDTTIEIKINLWSDQVDKKVDGQITGTVNYHRNFKGKGIKSRDIVVWLPPGYETDLNRRYPVLYMQDGQNIIDPQTSTFHVDWQIDETADSLIRQELIEPIIIVGIYNTPDRDKEYSEAPLGIAYMNFIVDSLKPFIDRTYRTKIYKENTANGGASLGGLISFMMVWEHSDVFSKAICFSPAFDIADYNFVDNVRNFKGQKKQIKIYINNGNNELDSELQIGVDEMIKALIEKGYSKGKDFYFFEDENAQHSERDWAKNVWRSLIFLFGTEKGRELL